MSREGAETRLTCQQQLDVVKLPPPPPGAAVARAGEGEITRYMGHRAAWVPGSDIATGKVRSKQWPVAPVASRAFGGQVYAQSALAVCRAWREQEDRSGVPEAERMGLHVCYLFPLPSRVNTVSDPLAVHPRLLYKRGDL